MNRSNEPVKRQFLLLILFVIFISLIILKEVHAEDVTLPYQGLTLNANLELAQDTDLQKGVVLIVHGVMGHNGMEVIKTAQQSLLENGQSSLAINISLGINNRRGFYDCNVPHRHSHEDAVNEIAVWVNWLRQRDVKKITLMAHSQGANQVMVYAAEKNTPEVTRLIFLAPFTIDDSKELLGARYGNDIDQVLSQAMAAVKAGKGDHIMENTDFQICPQSRVSAKSYISYYGEEGRFRNFPAYLPRIKVPTLITTGTHDERQPDIARHVRPYVDGRLIQLQVIQGADHFFRDFNIEEAMEKAVRFIQATS